MILWANDLFCKVMINQSIYGWYFSALQVKIAKILMIPEDPIERINFEPLNSWGGEKLIVSFLESQRLSVVSYLHANISTRQSVEGEVISYILLCCARW